MLVKDTEKEDRYIVVLSGEPAEGMRGPYLEGQRVLETMDGAKRIALSAAVSLFRSGRKTVRFKADEELLRHIDENIQPPCRGLHEFLGRLTAQREASVALAVETGAMDTGQTLEVSVPLVETVKVA
jgi:hypothetical protein